MNDINATKKYYLICIMEISLAAIETGDNIVKSQIEIDYKEPIIECITDTLECLEKLTKDVKNSDSKKEISDMFKNFTEEEKIRQDYISEFMEKIKQN